MSDEINENNKQEKVNEPKVEPTEVSEGNEEASASEVGEETVVENKEEKTSNNKNK